MTIINYKAIKHLSNEIRIIFFQITHHLSSRWLIILTNMDKKLKEKYYIFFSYKIPKETASINIEDARYLSQFYFIMRWKFRVKKRLEYPAPETGIRDGGGMKSMRDAHVATCDVHVYTRRSALALDSRGVTCSICIVISWNWLGSMYRPEMQSHVWLAVSSIAAKHRKRQVWRLRRELASLRKEKRLPFPSLSSRFLFARVATMVGKIRDSFKGVK